MPTAISADKKYKVRGVEFTVNGFGCLISCSDIESLYEPNDRTRRPHQSWRGTNRDLFKVGLGGRYWATPKFFTEAARRW